MMRTLAHWLLTIALTASVSAFAHAQGTTGGGAGGTGGGGGGGGTGGGTGGAGGTGGGASGTGPFAGTVQSGFSGGLGTAATSATPTGTNAIPSASNAFRTTYGNPYAIGQSVLGSAGTRSGTANKGFGQPVYATTTTGVGATRGGTTTGLGQANTANASGFSQTNLSRVPRYTTNLASDVPFVTRTPAQLQSQLQDVISRSSRLPSASQIRVLVDRDVVVLVGQVSNPRERVLAESMLLLSPGVDYVDNQLTVAGRP